MAAPDIPHLAWPFRLEPTPDGGLRSADVDQDSPEHIEDRADLVLNSPLGDFIADPTFGVAGEVLRAGGARLEELEEALMRSEPEIASRVRLAPGSGGVIEIQVVSEEEEA